MTLSASDKPGIEWHVLHCHPVCLPPHRLQVRAGIARQKDMLVARYEVTGDLHFIKIPATMLPSRHDELWRHTCAELFVGNHAGIEYAEYNFAPSLQWAAYSFSGYRQGMKLLATIPPQLDRSTDQSRLLIAAAIHAPESCHGVAISAGLSMVIENNDGACSYWALKHDSPRPDFHRRENWICLL